VFDTLQSIVIFALSTAALVGAIWALIDAMKFPDSAFVNAGKKSKVLWGVILGAAVVVAFVSLPPPLGRGGGVLGFLGIAAIFAVVFYFVDVRPKLRENNYGSGRGRSSGGW
jgi:hypothetical protein